MSDGQPKGKEKTNGGRDLQRNFVRMRRAHKKGLFLHDHVMHELIDEFAEAASSGIHFKRRKDIRALKLFKSELQRDMLLDELVKYGILNRGGTNSSTVYSFSFPKESSLFKFLCGELPSRRSWERLLSEMSHSDGTAKEYGELLGNQLTNILKLAFYASEYENSNTRRLLNRLLPAETQRLVDVIDKMRNSNEEEAKRAFSLAISAD